MAYPMKAAGQHMNHKAPDMLTGFHAHAFITLITLITLMALMALMALDSIVLQVRVTVF